MAKDRGTQALFEHLVEAIADFYCTTIQEVRGDLIDSGADECLMDAASLLEEMGY